MNATHDTITVPLSLNSYLTNYYFCKLNRIPKDKQFQVSYSYKKPDREKTFFKYKGYNSFEEFTELTKDELPENRKWMEILKDGYFVKECYDLDANSNPDKPQIKMFRLYKEKGADYMIEEFLKLRSKFIEEHYPKYYSHVYDKFHSCSKEGKHAIKVACTDEKFSVHIAINNRVYFEMPQLKMFGEKFSEFLNTTNFMIDTSIYSKNRCIRMLGNTKHGQNRHLQKHSSCSNLDDSQFLFQYPLVTDDLEHYKFPYDIPPEKKQKIYIQNCEKPNIIFEENENIDYKEMTQLLNLINSKENPNWSTIKQCIYDKTGGSDEGLEIFTKWSRDGGNIFTDDEYYKEWVSAKFRNYETIPTLKKYAKEQSPEQYDELYPRVSFLRKNESCPDDVGAKDIVDDCTHNNLAKIYSEKCNGEIFYTNGYGWIIYDSKLKIWTWDNNEKALKYPISCFFSDIVKNYAKHVFDTTKTTSKHEEKEFQERIMKIMKVKEKVGNSSFIGGIIEQLQSILTKDNKFVDIFDSKPNLLAFSDGKLIDLNNGGKVRDIVKEDYIMTTTGYPYPERNSVYIDKMNNIINSLSDDPEQIKSIKSSLSLPFWGENKNELFIQYTGSGGNGKGLLDTGISKVLGNYYTSMNSNQLTSYEKESGRANGELAGCRFSRLVMCTEPEDVNSLGSKTTLKTSTIKKWTGRDIIRTRFMYKQPIAYTPKFILMLQLNALLNLSTCDNAMKRRLRVIELPFKFVKNDGQPLEDNEKYQNETLKQLISTDDYRDAFFYILLDTWLETNGIFYESNQVKLTTNEFFESQNPLKEWFDKNYEIDRECQILVKDMWEKYKESNEYIGEKVFSKHLKEICKIRNGGGNKSFAFCKIKIVSVDSSEIEENEIVRLLPRYLPPL